LGSYFEGKGLPLLVPWAIVVLNVVVVMINALYERRREIGILSSVGLNPAQIAAIFVTEASITGFIAGGIGYLAGIGVYKLIPLMGLTIEVHQKVSAVWSIAAIGISISAVLAGALIALRSSIVITPSLTRRWKMVEGKMQGEPWEIPIPLKLEKGELEDFQNYLIDSLKDLQDDPIKKTGNIKHEERDGVKIITFNYKSTQSTTGNFYTRNTITIEPTEEVYIIKLRCLGDSEWAHVAGSLIRRIAMEWSNRPRRI
jgi:hypothetical protein